MSLGSRPKTVNSMKQGHTALPTDLNTGKCVKYNEWWFNFHLTFNNKFPPPTFPHLPLRLLLAVSSHFVLSKSVVPCIVRKSYVSTMWRLSYSSNTVYYMLARDGETVTKLRKWRRRSANYCGLRTIGPTGQTLHKNYASSRKMWSFLIRTTT